MYITLLLHLKGWTITIAQLALAPLLSYLNHKTGPCTKMKRALISSCTAVRVQLPYWTHAVGIHAYWPVRVQLYSTWTYRSVCSTVQHCIQLYSRRKLAGIQRSLRNDVISRNRRNLQNRNSAAAGIAIRFGPNVLLKCSVRQTGPKYPTITLDFTYKSSFSLNHKFNHYLWCTRDFPQGQVTGGRGGRF